MHSNFLSGFSFVSLSINAVVSGELDSAPPPNSLPKSLIEFSLGGSGEKGSLFMKS